MRDQNRWDYEDERRRGQRGWTERAGDEMRSWFGDDDAQARRELDERDERWRPGSSGDTRWRERGDAYEGGPRYGDAREGGYGVDPERRGYAGQSDRPSFSRSRGYRGQPQVAGQGTYRQGGQPGGQYRQPVDDAYRGEGRDWNDASWRAPHRVERQDFAGFEAGARDWQGGYTGVREPGDYESGSTWRQARDTRDRSRETFSGRGPKDYTRSDDRIREEVSDRLTDDHAVDASEMTVHVQNGEVTLTGAVPDREQKRRAEDLAEMISGVRQVTNNLRVNRAGQSTSHDTGNESTGRGQAMSQAGASSGTSASGAASKANRSNTTA